MKFVQKITVWISILITTVFASFFVSPTHTVSAQSFRWGNTNIDEAKVPFCQNGNCTTEAGLREVENNLDNTVSKKTLTETIIEIVRYAMGFVTFVAVCFILWSGFGILTSNGDDKKLEDAKKTITYVAVGIILMWLSYSIVALIINTVTKRTVWYTPQNYAWNILPQANAQAFSENQYGTFAEYKAKIISLAQDLERDFNVKKSVSVSSLQEAKRLVQAAALHLPDKDPTEAGNNESLRKATEMYIDIAIQTPNSYTEVGRAIQNMVAFAQNASVKSIQGTVRATPSEGNAPLNVSFDAINVIDPSGTTPPAQNYIWWIRGNNGSRQELGRGPSINQTFTNEGTYSVNLDVISASRNKKGKIDVLPFTTTTIINVKPKLGEIVLLVNGINVTNLDSLKVSPTVANNGLFFDASASRAIGNWRIAETKWNFGNGNSRTYKNSPVVEREIFATQGTYDVELSLVTNDGQTITKKLQLIIREPAATIRLDNNTAHIGDSVTFSAETYLGDSKNVRYTWQIQDTNEGKRIVKSSEGSTLNHTFTDIGQYLITLRTQSPNGSEDTDTKILNIESRNPVASLNFPTQISSEKPNTFVFNAEKSHDPDSNSRQDLQYTWRINGEKIELNNPSPSGDKGTYTFDATGEYTASVTVINKYGKIAEAEQKFSVSSTLAGELSIQPQVTQVGKKVTFTAESQNAKFFSWNFGDGTPVEQGNKKSITHTFQRTGSYDVVLELRDNSDNSTTIRRRVYVSDMDSPFAMIDVSNSSNSAILEPGLCYGEEAYVLKRGEYSTFYGGNSINVDGGTSNLEYTWRYMGKVSTLPSINETFTDLGCFPVELTVRSKTNGATATSKIYIQLKNQAPELTNISATVDANKKDSQKVIVKTTANGATDKDGVITSYIWYYTTESDNEPQNIQITQNPNMTFILPNITEKYYFGVILEDNDGARVNSKDLLQGQTPLLLDNANGNIHMPLISLKAPNKAVKVGESVTFSAQARTIMGNDVTSKSQYAWDFDGDGKIDEKTTTSSISHVYNRAGNYTMKVRVTNNGVSNTKYQTISVRNELKASTQAYLLPNDKLYILNTSQGVFDKATWTIGDKNYENLDSLVLDLNDVPVADEKGNIGELRISNYDSEVTTTPINIRRRIVVESSTDNSVIYQSFPQSENDTITLSDPASTIKISMYGNEGTNFAIDTDTDMDSNLDGVSDNDIDNKEATSYTDGSVFAIGNFGNSKTKTRKIRLSTYNGSTLLASKVITVNLDFVTENPGNDNLSELSTEKLSLSEKEKLDRLAAAIRNLTDGDRILAMQDYNNMVENWDSMIERTTHLVNIETSIMNSQTVDQSAKETIVGIINEMFQEWSQTGNEIETAIKLVRILTSESASASEIQEKLDQIFSHPNNIEANRPLARDILSLIQHDEKIPENNKIAIKNALRAVIDGGSANIDPSSIEKTSDAWVVKKSGGGFWEILKIFGWILLVLIGIGIILVVIFSIKNRKSGTSLQDNIIDGIFHKKTEKTSEVKTETKVETKVENIDNDPLKTFTPPVTVTGTVTASTTSEIIDPLAAQEDTTPAPMPDWLKENNPETTTASVSTNDTNGGLPDWLAPKTDTTEKTETTTQNAEWWLPDWLAPLPDTSKNDEKNITNSQPIEETSTLEKPQEIIENNLNDDDPFARIDENTFSYTSSKWYSSEITKEEIPSFNNDSSQKSELPDWLKTDSTKTENTSEGEKSENISDNNGKLPDWLSDNKVETNITESSVEKISENSWDTSLPEWLNQEIPTQENTEISDNKNSEASQDLPDWLMEKPSEKPETTTEDPLSSDKNTLPNWLTEWTEKIIETAENINKTAEKISENITPETPDALGNFAKNSEKWEIVSPSETSIPDWLVDTNSSDNNKNNTVEKPKKEKSSKPKKSPKKEEIQTSDNDDIPEWLK